MSLYVPTRTKYAIVGGDYSQQEPRLLTHMCKDENLTETYNNKKDLYATIGSFVFGKSYWECMEHWEDGSPNPDGGKIRKKCKSLVLGIMYGMGANLMATNIGVSVEECRSILEEFYKRFPTIKEFTVNNENDAKKVGYVEDYMGRRRHLPDAKLEQLEITAKKNVFTDASLFIDCTPEDAQIEIKDEEETSRWISKWQEAQSIRKKGVRQSDVRNSFKEEARKNGVHVFDNGAYISKSMTQCTNARIQGSAATLTKKAMVSIANDAKMKELGFRILIPVHDELLGECPVENTEEAEKRLVELMVGAAKPECSVDMKVDTYAVNRWYEDEFSNLIQKEFNGYIKGNESKGIKPISEEDAIDRLCLQYTEISEDVIRSMCNGTFDILHENRI